MELAIINGTYRDGSKLQQKMNQILIPGGNVLAAAVAANSGIRSPSNHLGQPLIISPRINGNGNSGNSSLSTTQITDPSTGLIYTTIPGLYQDPSGLGAALEYPNGIDFSQAGMQIIFVCPLKNKFLY